MRESVDDEVIFAGRQWICAPKPGVKVGGIIRHFVFGERDRVEEPAERFDVPVLDRDARMAPERHRKVAVEAAGRIDVYRQGVDVDPGVESVATEVAVRRYGAGDRMVASISRFAVCRCPGRKRRSIARKNRYDTATLIKVLIAKKIGGRASVWMAWV